MKYKKNDVLMSWDNMTQIKLLSNENNKGEAKVQVLQDKWLTNTKQFDIIEHFQIKTGIIKFYYFGTFNLETNTISKYLGDY